jgi:hypothetical protein
LAVFLLRVRVVPAAGAGLLAAGRRPNDPSVGYHVALLSAAGGNRTDPRRMQ